MNNWWEVLNLYEKKAKRTTIEVGDIVWAPVLYNDKNEKRRILNIERATVDNDTHNKGVFEIEPLDFKKHYKTTAETLPMKKLGLRIGEEFILHRSKLRPCIVLHIDSENIQKMEENDNGVNNLNQKSVLLLPLYGFQNRVTGEKFSPNTVNNMKHLGHKKILFFPKDPDATNDSIIVKDSFGRFDMMFQIPSSFITCTKSKLTDEFLIIVDFYLQNYLGNNIDEKYFENALFLLEEAHKSLIM